MSAAALHIHIANDPVYVENGMTIYLNDGGPCWIIDPGLPPQAEQIVQHVRDHSLDPRAIMLTHAHADHIAGIDDVRKALGPIPVYLGREEWPALSDPNENLSSLMACGLRTQVRDPKDLRPGSELELDGTRWRVLDTSGHSPGGRSLIVGDALFAGSIGRVDFPAGDGDRLVRNLHEQLMTLPDETRVLSGHGPETTIGRERVSNPFLIHGL